MSIDNPTGQDIRNMHHHELLRGLMRGNRAELKLGYSPENALRAVKKMRPELDEAELRGYAEGFQDGMNPEMVPMWVEIDESTPEHRAYVEGYGHGRNEDPSKTYPSSNPV